MFSPAQLGTDPAGGTRVVIRMVRLGRFEAWSFGSLLWVLASAHGGAVAQEHEHSTSPSMPGMQEHMQHGEHTKQHEHGASGEHRHGAATSTTNPKQKK